MIKARKPAKIKRTTFKRLNKAACALALLLCAGCVSLVDNAGRALDGSASSEKKLARYQTAEMEVQEVRNKAGERSIIITLEKFPQIKIRGSASDEQGIFYLTSLDYLGGNVHGWNEYRLILSGTGSLNMDEKTAILAIPHGIETVQITSGRIHRYDTRITGNDAIASLNNRRERILALVEWMAGQDAPSGASVNAGVKDFEKYWKPLLLPETVSKSRQPPDWQHEGDSWVKAEDIRWNAGYTGRVFPEELWQVRNSGTLLRDWEEALPWIYLEYEWENIAGFLSAEIVLQRKK
jgi:hypothetical protein